MKKEIRSKYCWSSNFKDLNVKELLTIFVLEWRHRNPAKYVFWRKIKTHAQFINPLSFSRYPFPFHEVFEEPHNLFSLLSPWLRVCTALTYPNSRVMIQYLYVLVLYICVYICRANNTSVLANICTLHSPGWRNKISFQ